MPDGVRAELRARLELGSVRAGAIKRPFNFGHNCANILAVEVGKATCQIAGSAQALSRLVALFSAPTHLVKAVPALHPLAREKPW